MASNVRELRAEFVARTDGMRSSLQTLRGDINRIGEDSRRSAGEMGQRFTDASKKLKNVGQNFTKFVTAPLAGAALASTKFSIDQEKSFAKVSTLLTGSASDFEKYKKDIRKASSEMGVSFDDYSESVYGAISAGVEQGEAIKFVAEAAKLAKGGFTENATAVDIMTTAINAYGLEADEATRVSDILVNTQNLGKTTVDELASSMGAVIPVAQGQNVSLEQLSTGYAVLTKNGIATSEAGTYMKSMFGELGKAGSEVDEILREKTGKGFSQLSDEGMNVGEVLQILQGHAEDSGIKMGDLFGSMEAGSAAMVLAGGEGKEFTEILGSMSTSAGATEEAFIKMENTTGEKMGKALNRLKNAGAEIGDKVLPYVADAAEWIGKMVEKFSAIDPQVQLAVGAFAVFAGAIGPVLMIVGSMASGLGAVMTLFGGVAGATTVAGTAAAGAAGSVGLFGTVLGALTGPVGLTIAALAGITAGGVLLYKSMKEDTIPVFDRFGDKVSDATKKALGGFFELSDGASDQLMDLRINGTEITELMADELISKYEDMNTEILEGMKKRHTDELDEMKSIFLNSTALTDEQEEKIIRQREIRNDGRMVTQQHYEDRITEIVEKALIEKRELTDHELASIDSIHKEMNEAAVEYLTDNEMDQKIILERMATYADDMTARQAADVVKNSAKQRDEVVAEKEKTFDEVVAFAIRERDETGTISAKEADDIIAEAKRKRDGAVREAEIMHEDVVEEAKKQAGKHINEVDWETGEILSKWDVYKRDVIQKFKDTNEESLADFKKWGGDYKSWAEDVKEKANETWKKYGDDIVTRFKGFNKDTIDDFKKWGQDYKDWAKDVKEKANKTWKDYGNGVVERFKRTNKDSLDDFKGWADNVKQKATQQKEDVLGLFTDLKNGTIKRFRDLKDGATDRFDELKKNTKDLGKDMLTGLRKTFDDMVSGARRLPGRIGDGIKAMGYKAKDGIKAMGNKMMSGLGTVVNGAIGGVNWVLRKLDVDTQLKYWTPPKYAKGTKKHPGGLAIVNDGVGTNSGEELIQTPDGKTGTVKGKNVMVNLPKGSQVLSATKTKDFLKTIPAYAWGTDAWGGIKSGVSKTWNKAKDIGSSVKNTAMDVFSYLKKPGKFLDIALRALGVEKPTGSGMMAEMAKGGFNKAKDAAVSKVASILKTFGVENSGGPADFGSGFRKTSSYGWRTHPITKKRTFHNGDDYGAASGTPIPNQAAGQVAFAGYHNGRGNYVKIRSGNIDRIYQHNSRNSVRQGDYVPYGKTVGTVGSTGMSTGPHLHYEEWRNGQPIRPGSLKGVQLGKGGKGFGGQEVSVGAKYLSHIIGDGDYMNDWVTHLPKSIINSTMKQGKKAADYMRKYGSPARKYFSHIAEDGDWLNDWATHVPKTVKNPMLTVGKSLSNIQKFEDGGYRIDKEQLAWIADGGWAESVISYDPQKRGKQKAIWEQTGADLGFNNLSGGDNKQVNTLLTRIAQAVESGMILNIDGEDFAEILRDPLTKLQNLDTKIRDEYR